MSAGDWFSAELVRVIDGDTYWLDVDFEKEAWPGVFLKSTVRFPVRLLGADTPERGEPNYQEAISFASERLTLGPVSVGWPVGMSFNRYVCPIRFGADQLDLGKQLIAAGLAEPYPKMAAQIRPLP